MSRLRTYRRPLAAGLVLTAVGVAWQLGRTQSRPPASPAGESHAEHADSPFVEVAAETAAALGLQTETVVPDAFNATLAATGRIVPVEARQAHLGARVAGRLTGVQVRVGQRVAAGEVVATLDSVDAAQAAAAVREASARLAAARAYLANRERLVASGAVTLAPLEDARRLLADARVEQAKAASDLAQAQNEAESARAELVRTERLVSGGSYTTAVVDEARGKLAEAQRALAEARRSVADAAADRGEAEGAVQVARGKLESALALAQRTERLAATGELDRTPLEQAQNALADARSRLEQAQSGLEQANRQRQRGEELYRTELISQNDLEARRTAVREREAQRREATAAVANAQTAVARQQEITSHKMASGRALQEAQNATQEARTDLAAAEARLAKATSRLEAAQAGVAPAQEAVAAVQAGLDRERALAGDKTRAATAIEAARLRVTQAERSAVGKQGEVTEAAGKVQVAQGAVTREQQLTHSQARAREQLLEAERELRAAGIARNNAAEMLQILGAAAGAADRRGPVQLPIRAPLAGLVTAVSASVGEAVRPEQDLIAIVDLSEVYVEADVYEKDLPQVRQGQAVKVRVRGLSGEVFVGAVLSVSAALDSETRAAHVRALLPNPLWRLRPEMFAEVGFVTDTQPGAVTVAEEAVQEVEGHKVVFVQRTPDQYELRAVETGREETGRTAIGSGLKAGEVVVTRGSYLLKSQRLKGELGEGHAH